MAPAHLGQNFLANKNIAEKILRAFLPIPKGSPIVEVGPGKGMLTELLVKQAPDSPVKAIELDTGLFYKLREQYKDVENFEVINRNVLKVNLDYLFKDTGNIYLISNVPYYISLEFIDWVISQANRVEKGVLMLQKEFVGKLASSPNSKEYNPRGIMFSYLFRMEKLFDVQPGSFSPPPKVKSTVFQFERQPDRLHAGLEMDSFYAFLKDSFGNRRKTLLNNLQQKYSTESLWEIFETLTINPKIRAEQITIDEFINIYRPLSTVAIHTSSS